MAKTKFERPLPSEHERESAQAQEAEVKRREDAARKEARIKGAFDWLLKQENGRVVWAAIFERCGYNKAVLFRAAGGDIASLSTECAAAQREVYRDLRKLVPTPELLAAAEFEAEFGVKTKQEGEK